MKTKQTITLRLCSLFIVLATVVSAQNYTWKKGSNMAAQQGVFGTTGVPAAANTPGARDLAYTWKDSNGNFWLYGGLGIDATGNNTLLGDLWKYNPSTNQWVFVKGDSIGIAPGIYGTQGLPANSNYPGARMLGTSWADASGNLWLYGGLAIDPNFNLAEQNDLWKYNISTNQWTWMKGDSIQSSPGVYGTQGTPSASTTPGARLGSVSWTDATGKLWLFGGMGYDGNSNNGHLDDLWKYDPSTNQWTWIKGNNAVSLLGAYGTMGVPSATNNPGGRGLSATWTDASGMLWLFGGSGFANSGLDDNLNDLWRFNPGNNQWTWINGDSITSQNGIYGTMGVPASTSVPGSRAGMISWTDGAGNLCLFGGIGMDASNPNADYMNDIWKYNITNGQWMWANGSNIASQAGVYGTMGVPAATNTPGGRVAASGWKDASNNIWIFGGEGVDSGSNIDVLNDLWKLEECVAPTLSVTATKSVICSGETLTLNVTGANSYTWNTGHSTASISVSPTINTTYTVQGADNPGCSNSVVYTQSVNALPVLTTSGTKSVICAGQSLSLSVSGAQTYSWSNGLTGSSIIVTPSVSVTYTVKGTDVNGCSKLATVSQSVNACLGIKDSDMKNVFSLYPNPNKGIFTLKTDLTMDQLKLTIYNSIGQLVLKQEVNSALTQISSDLPTGIYIYQVHQGNKSIVSGKMIIN